MIVVAYKAGTAFIQITPSFRGFQLAVAAEVKKIRAVTINIDADVTKAKAKIDEVTGKAKPVTIKAELDQGAFERDVKGRLTAALRSLPTNIGLDVNASEAEREIASLRAQLETLSNERIGVDISADAALVEIEHIRAEMDRLGASSPNIQVQVDAASAAAQLEGVHEIVNRLDRDKVKIQVDADTGAATAKLLALGSSVGLIHVGVALTPMLGPVAALAAGAAGGLAGIGAGAIAGVGAGAAVGMASIKQALDLQKQLGQASKDRVTALAGVKSAEASAASAEASLASAQLSAARGVADAEKSLSDARRNGARAVLAAEQAVTDARRNGAQAASAAEQSLTDARRNGARAVLTAEQAVVDARRAGARAVQAAEQSVVEAQQAGARSVQAAVQSVTEARRNEAQVAVQGAQQVNAAEASLVTAQDAVRRSLEGLHAAREQAKQDLADLKEASKDDARSVEAAQIALIEAQRNLASVESTAHPGDLELRKARLQLADAENAVSDAKRRQAKDTKDLTKAEKDGVDGSAGVKSARQQVADARKAAAAARAEVAKARADAARANADAARKLASAEKNLGQTRRDAARNVARAEKNLGQVRADAARNVARAEKNLGQARSDAARSVARAEKSLAQVQADAARNIARAEQGLGQTRGDAARSTSTAQRNLDRARVDGATRVANAHRQVADAHARVAAAQDKVTAADKKRAGILGQMTPQQKRLIAGIASLKTSWNGFLADVSKPVANAALDGIHAIQKALPALAIFVKPVERALGSVFRSFGNAAGSKGFKSFAADFGKFSAGIIRDGGKVLLNLGKGFGGILKAFMPLSKSMSGGLVNLTKSFGDWGANLSKSKGFQNFIKYVRKEGPPLLKLFRDIGVVVGKLFIALAPLGGLTLKGLEGLFGMLAKLKPTDLLLIATAIGAIGVAIAVAFDLNPIGALIVALVGISAGLVQAYKHVKWFRDVVNAVWHAIVAGAKWLYDVLLGHSIIPDIVNGILGWFRGMLRPVRDAWGKVTGAIHAAAVGVLGFLRKNWPLILVVLTGPIGVAVLAISKNWGKITAAFKAARDWVKGAFKTSWNGIKAVVMAPIDGARDLIKTLFGTNGPVRKAFTAVRDWVKSTWNRGWNGIKAIVMAPINGARDLIKALFGANGPVRNAFASVRDWIKGAWKTTWNGIKAVLLKPIQDARDSIKSIFGKGGPVRTAFSNAVDGIKGIWADLKEAVKGPIRFVVNTVYNKGILPFVNRIPFIPGTLQPIKGWSTGGYTGPGGKYDPAGIVHRDEFVIRKESRQNIEGHAPGFLDHLNRHGAKALPGYSQGGRAGGDGSVLMDGQRVSGIAARQIRLMERLAKVNFRVMQGGYGGHHIHASGTSHNYPGVVDLGPASIRYEKLARQVGFAAWARNIAGRGRIGSGAHIHAVSLLDPGDAKSPQVYGSWAGHRTGLNGGGPDPAPHYAWLPNLRKLLGNIPLAHLGGGGGGGGSSYSGPSVKDARSSLNPGRWLDALKHMGPWGGALGGMMGGVIGKLKSVVVGKIKSAIRAVFGGSGVNDISTDLTGISGSVAKQVVQVGKRLHASPRDRIISLMAGLQESGLRNLPGGDRDSVGVFQQRAPWGPYNDRHNVAKATAMFLQGGQGGQRGLFDFPSRGRMSLGQAAQAVQVSALPGAYAKWYTKARRLNSMYDSGGYLPPGLSQVYNGTSKPEAVFTTKQWADIHTLATRGADAGRGAPMVHIENQYTSDPGAAARETRREQMKAVALMRLSR